LKGVDGSASVTLRRHRKAAADRALNSFRQRDPIENFADEKVSLNGGQVFSHDLVVEPQTKQASRVAWGFKLNDNPLD
jgi:hypothetical protein